MRKMMTFKMLKDTMIIKNYSKFFLFLNFVGLSLYIRFFFYYFKFLFLKLKQIFNFIKQTLKLVLFIILKQVQ